MFSFGGAGEPQFGGVGVMVEPPAIQITIQPASDFRVVGKLAERAGHFAALAARSWEWPGLPHCELRIESPDSHLGLGVGTQLGLSVAAGMRRFLRLPDCPIDELAFSVGRGNRSAVGTFGFERGGLIVDAGQTQGGGAGRVAGRLADRHALPDGWRFVLVVRSGGQGLAGASEAAAFARLPPVPRHVTHELWQITRNDMLPAVERGDCRAFGESVYRFGRRAGECFAAVQGGAFADDTTERLVESIRDRGVAGVGQSSWGPAVYALCENNAQANDLARWICDTHSLAERDVTIACPCNHGAVVEPS
jgi:beta-RFAP synthase